MDFKLPIFLFLNPINYKLRVSNIKLPELLINTSSYLVNDDGNITINMTLSSCYSCLINLILIF